MNKDLLKEREEFQKRAMAVPVVEKKKEEDREGGASQEAKHQQVALIGEGNIGDLF